jgi:tetratricopeptide (TPR) repeat protein
MKRIAQVLAGAVALLLLGGIGLRAAAPGDAVANTPAPAADALTAPALSGADVARTIDALRERIRAVPDDHEALTALGLAEIQRARATGDPSAYPRAASALRRALDLQGADPDPRTLIGSGALALARHDFSAALQAGRAAAELNPDDGDAYGVIGDALVELGRYRAAFAAFQRMVDTEPGVGAYARVSYARELRGDVAGAIEAMSAAERVAGTPADAAWAAAHVGQLRLRSGDVRGAALDFRRAAGLDPDAVAPEAGLARVAFARGDVEAAIERGERVAARYPAAEHVIWLAEVYEAAEEQAQAAEQREVVGAIQRLAEVNGVNVDLEVALFEADHGDPAAALTAARAEWSRRRSIHSADALAWALHANGDDRAALRYTDLALRLGTDDALLHYHAGMIHLAAGDRSGAEALLRRALALDPSFSPLHAPRARAALERIGGDA